MSTSLNRPDAQSPLAKRAVSIDHIAIAVPNLEASVAWFTSVLGFYLKEWRKTEGSATAMISAVIEAGPLNFVLLQGTSAESQVSRYLAKYGPGVHHLAIQVEDIKSLTNELQASKVQFDTSLIEGPGLRQIFSKRDESSGVMIEFIERTESGFSDQNVKSLFEQLERNNSF